MVKSYILNLSKIAPFGSIEPDILFDLSVRLTIAFLEAENTNIFEWDSKSDRCVVIIGAKDLNEAADVIFKEYYFNGTFDNSWNFDECMEKSIEFRNVVNYLDKRYSIYSKENLRYQLDFVINFIKERVKIDLENETPVLKWFGFDVQRHLKSNYSSIKGNPLKREAELTDLRSYIKKIDHYNNRKIKKQSKKTKRK